MRPFVAGMMMLFALAFLHLRSANACFIGPPDAGLSVARVEVAVEIQGTVARTTLRQTLVNRSGQPIRDIEALFPLPNEAAVSLLSTEVDGQSSTAILLDAAEAARRYEQAILAGANPALLEFAGAGAYGLRLGNFDPGEARTVVFAYEEILPVEARLARYHFPLARAGFSGNAEEVAVIVRGRADTPMRDVFTPYQSATIARPDDRSFTVEYRAAFLRPDDFDLYYALDPGDVALALVGYRHNPGYVMSPANPALPRIMDGYFLLLASPKVEVAEGEAVPKDVVIVLDRSGSMQGEKISQAREGLKFVVDRLGPEDDFNVLAFNSSVQTFRPAVVRASSADRNAAKIWIDGIGAQGGTNLYDALLAGLTALPEGRERPALLVFLTDGLATAGTTDNESILRATREANQNRGARIFAFGIGNDVNAVLLDRLASENNGASAFIRSSENVTVTLTDFYRRVERPVLTHLSLDMGSSGAYDVFPTSLPDLYAGSQIVLAGRFTNPGTTSVLLRGRAGPVVREFTADLTFPMEDSRFAFVPRLWATRKVGALLQQIRVQGEDPALVEELKRIALRFGIVTPYTTFQRTADGSTSMGYAAPRGGESGAGAVEDSRSIGGASNAQSVSRSEPDGALRVVGDKTFIMAGGYWTDVEYPEGTETINVTYRSESYLELLRRAPAMGRYFAVGKSVLFGFRRAFYRVTDSAALSIPPESSIAGLPGPEDSGAPGRGSSPTVIGETEPGRSATRITRNLPNPADRPLFCACGASGGGGGALAAVPLAVLAMALVLRRRRVRR